MVTRQLASMDSPDRLSPTVIDALLAKLAIDVGVSQRAKRPGATMMRRLSDRGADPRRAR